MFSNSPVSLAGEFFTELCQLFDRNYCFSFIQYQKKIFRQSVWRVSKSNFYLPKNISFFLLFYRYS
ncbi:hypothetical protein AMQ68_23540 [Chryseobacterium sp. ERMR1:04]|nr:hypothetical protein AMQ68_23540 [Chryseobacterium sp. ERMR1:04]